MDTLLAIPGAAWNTGGAFVLLFMLFVGLLKGWIVTAREHEGRMADKDKAIDTLTQTIKVKDDQIEKLSIVHEFQRKVWTSLEKVVKEREKA